MTPAPAGSIIAGCDELDRKTRSTGALQGPKIVETLKKAFQALGGVFRKFYSSSSTGRAPSLSNLEVAGSSPVRCSPRYHYVIVRDDLPRGTALAQTVHAAGESSPGDLPPGTRAVVLAARDVAHLEQVERELVRHQIPHQAIREPDAPYCNALMAIGVVPVSDRKRVSKVTSKLPLLR